MTSLKILDISFNSIFGFPDEIADLANLQLLDAYSNKISEIHPSFLSLNLTALGMRSRMIDFYSPPPWENDFLRFGWMGVNNFGSLGQVFPLVNT